MFPIRDHNPSFQIPYVNYALIAINILVFLSYLPLMGNEQKLTDFFNNWAMTPADVSKGSEIYTLISSMFMHGSFMHLAGNMLFLWIFGDNIEDSLGHVLYLVFYLACGFGADAAHLLSDTSSTVPTVGASGAIAGIMGAYLLLFPKARVDIIAILGFFISRFTWPAWVVLSLWMAMQIFGGFFSSSEGGGVAYWAHIGGFFTGMILILPIWLKRGGIAFWDKTKGQPPYPPVDYEMRKSRIPNTNPRDPQYRDYSNYNDSEFK